MATSMMCSTLCSTWCGVVIQLLLLKHVAGRLACPGTRMRLLLVARPVLPGRVDPALHHAAPPTRGEQVVVGDVLVCFIGDCCGRRLAWLVVIALLGWVRVCDSCARCVRTICELCRCGRVMQSSDRASCIYAAIFCFSGHQATRRPW
jgi:hypothetical protein